jgi:pimeloyl-ACP methyl ester carboxylesterase
MIDQRIDTMFATSIDGTRIAYETTGAGHPLVLLHGFTDSRRSWCEAGHVDALVARGRQTILIDCRGHGDSGKPHDAAAYSLKHRVADILAVLNELDVRRADLIGYSMGGFLALMTAALMPERVGALAVIGAHPFAQDLNWFRIALSGGIEGWVNLVESHGTPLPARVRERMLGNDIAALRACVARDRPDASGLLADFRAPVLAIAGTRDPHFEAVVRLARMVRGQFLALEGQDHFSCFLAVSDCIPAILDHFDNASTQPNEAVR